MTSIGSTTQTSYCAVVPSSAFASLTNIAITPVSTTYAGYLNINYFVGNTYNGNLFTGGKSLIHLEGSPRTYFETETFTNNGDMTKEGINVYGTNLGWTILTASSTEVTIAGGLTSPASIPSANLG